MIRIADGKVVCSLSFLLMSCMGSASATPVLTSYLNPLWTDANKSHDAGNWSKNSWNDTNNNDHWENTETLADAVNGTWSSPKTADDNSCWIASAANMLASAGFASSNAQGIYWDMVYNMDFNYTSDRGWEYGGWQHEAVNWYLSNRPHPDDRRYAVYYYGVYDGRDGTTAMAWPSDPFDLAADLLSGANDFLSRGAQVGIVIHGSPKPYHAVTFQGYNSPLGQIYITDSDADKRLSGLDDYGYDLGAPTNWRLSDYIKDGIPVDYFAVLAVPEPDALSLMLIGGWLLAKKRRRGKGASTDNHLADPFSHRLAGLGTEDAIHHPDVEAPAKHCARSCLS